MEKRMTYTGVGVDYDSMDPFKRAAQAAGRETRDNLRRFDYSEVEASRGESAYLIETPVCYLAHVEEGLGTKNLVADAMYEMTGKSYYDHIAQDTVAMIVNDMITLGALPLSVAMHLAVGDSNWFKDEQRSNNLVEGWKKACDLARCAWSGGETPTLKDVVIPGAVVLSGSAIGLVKPKGRLITGNIEHGDAIIIIESSGIHANGLTMARKIGEKAGYLTRVTERTYGAMLLDPTHIYVGIIEECLSQGVEIHYAVNITGHGWRKIMRHPKPFTYLIEQLPTQLPVFDFMQRHGPIDDREAYANFNMGAGFALYVPEKEVNSVLYTAFSLGFTAFKAGYIEESEEKRVVIKPKNLVYSGESLKVR